MAGTEIDLGYLPNSTSPIYDQNYQGGDRNSSGITQIENYRKVIDAELIYPRPDSETPTWARHRKAYTGRKYEFAIGVANGAWPFYYEVISGPSGLTVGTGLNVDGNGALTPAANYGVVSWDSPTAGTHSVTVRVSFQDGATAIDVVWEIVVGTSGHIFVDASVGSSGTGTLASPFKNIDDWYLADSTDTTYSEFHVHYAAGTYDVFTSDATNNNNIVLDYHNKPLVHIGEVGESVIWDFDTGNLVTGIEPEFNGLEQNFHDFYCGDIEWTGGKQEDGARRLAVFATARGDFPYDPDGSIGGCRNTWFRSNQTSWTYTGDASNNAGICFASNAGDVDKGRSHWYISHLDISDITNGHTNFNGWFIGQMRRFLVEHITESNTDFGRGPFSGKSSEWGSCYRNLDLVAAPDQSFVYDNAGSYAPLVGGNTEVSYSRFKRISGSGNDAVIESGHHNNIYSAGNPYHDPNYHFRNNISGVGGSAAAFNAFFDWPVFVYDDIWCSNTTDGISFDGPVNTQVDGGWLLFTTANNPFDADLNLLSDTNRGTLGAEMVEA